MDNADASDANSTSDTIADLITGATEDQQHFDSLVSDSTLTSPVGADAHLESLPISSPEAYDRQLSGEGTPVTCAIMAIPFYPCRLLLDVCLSSYTMYSFQA